MASQSKDLPTFALIILRHDESNTSANRTRLSECRSSKYPAVLVTAYLPDPGKWESGFKRRRK